MTARKRRTPGLAKQKLAVFLANLEPEEVFDAVERLMPQKIRSHIQARGYDRLGVVGQFVGDLVRRHGLEEFYDRDFGFVAGPAREEYALWYLSMYASPSQLARPLVREVLLVEAFGRARKIIEPAIGA